MKRPRFLFWAAVLAGVGAIILLRGDIEWRRTLLAILIAAGIALAHRPISKVLNMLRRPSPTVVAMVAVVSIAYLAGTAFIQQRDLFPKVHDEHSYLLGARMLATGRLWMPQHELADFFESFHILVRPKYASIYFPGTALLNVPAIWTSSPTWEWPLLMASACVVLTYLVVGRLIDGSWGLVAAVLLLATGLFRTHSTLVMSQIPATLLGLATVGAYLLWQARPTALRAASVGIAAGFAAITRPVDALAFAVPVAIAMLLQLRGQARAAWFKTALLLVAGAAPFLILQAVFNEGVTGGWFKSPYVVYLDQNQPGSQFGNSIGRQSNEPSTTLPQKRDYYRQLVAGNFGAWVDQSFPSWVAPRAGTLLTSALPTPLLAPLVVLGLGGMFRRGCWVLGSVAPLFFCLYLLNPFFLPHYSVPLAPVLALLTVLGAHTLTKTMSRTRASGYFATLLPLVLVCLAASRLPELNRAVRDEWIDLPIVQMAHHALPQAVQGPAVVFFRYRSGENVHDELVYNDEAAWPDEQEIVRLQDLGERNRQAIAYYSSRQPARRFFLFDRSTATLYPYDAAPPAATQHAN